MLVSQQDTFYQALLTHNNTFGLILDVVYETMPRDNLLNSACLEFFEAVRRDNMKSLVIHVVEKYRERLQNITYVDTFHNLIHRYEQMQGYDAEAESVLLAQDEARKLQANGQRWQGPREMDAAEEAYFNTSDDEEDVWFPSLLGGISVVLTFGCSGSKPTRRIPCKTALFSRLLNRWLITLTMTMMMPWIHKQTRHKPRTNKERLPRSLPLHHLHHHLTPPLNGYQRNAGVKRKMKTSWSS